jgi:pimeloyl-ACP methyl ester carboxylesterase
VTLVHLEGFEERRAPAGGCDLRYFVGGVGPPLVLVHGLGGSALNWAQLAPELARTRRVLVPDLPGHGRSAPLPAAERGARALEPYARVVAALVAREGMSAAAVVGHSLGGLVSLRLAVAEPEAVSELVLAAPAGISSTRRLARAALPVLAVVRPGRRISRFRRRVAASPRLRVAVFGYWGAADPAALPPAAVHGFLAGWDWHSDTWAAARALLRDDPRTELGRIRCPCLVLWGARDNQVPVADGFEFARRLGAPLRVVADCGHLLIGERPDACLDAITRFLDPRAAAGAAVPAASDRVRDLDELPGDAEAVG